MKKNFLCCVFSLLVVGVLILGSALESFGAAAQPKRLTISGGTLGGSSNLVAVAWAGVAKKYLNLDATVITYPTVAQVDAVLSGLANIATGLPDVAQEAYDGSGAYKKKGPRKDLRAMAYRQGTILQIVTPVKSNIKTFRDMVGKRISAGKKGFSSDYNFKQLVEVLGLSYEKDFRIVYMGHPEAAAALTSGKLDAYIVSASLPQPTMAETDMTNPLRLVTLTKDDIQKALKSLPYYELVVIPPKAVYHQTEQALQLNLPAFNVVTTALSDDVVYNLMKSYMENPTFVGHYYKPLQTLIESGDIKRWVETVGGIPWHAGVYRWYMEKGWKVPTSRIPPEIKK